MKNLMARIKGADYKGLFLRHGEKVGMAVTALIALVCLAITNWKGYPGTPDELKAQATDVETKLRSNPWPSDVKAGFVPMKSEHAVASMQDPVNLGNFTHGVIFSPKLYTYRQPADEPVVVTVSELQVRSGQMPLDVVPPIVDESEETADENSPVRAAARPDRGASPLRGRAAERAADKAADGLAESRIGVRPGTFQADRPTAGVARGGGNKPGGGGNKPSGRAGGNSTSAIIFGQGDDDIAAAAAGYSGGGMGGMGTLTGKARGVRYNVVTGIIDRRKQLEMLKKALHLESPADVPEYLEYVDFKIQRQRAMPGPKPWSDDPNSWKDLDTNHSIELLSNEATDFDPDVVSAEYINDALTSPLPHRLDGDWDFAEVGHPKIPMLDLEGRALEAYMNLTAADIAAEAGLDEEELRYAPRGFRRVQKDPTQLRQQAMRVDGGGARMNNMLRGAIGNPDDDDERPRGMGSRMRGGPAAARPARPATGVARPALPGVNRSARPNPTGIPMGADDYDYYSNVGGATVADTILFRYFDFDVEPGECYRYRVQIVISNPSAEEEFVSSPEVAAGYDRSSDWSKPSPLVVVPRDVEYSLARISRRAGRREGAVLNVVQFDTDVGTLIADNLPVHYGEYVAGAKKTDHLNLAVPSFIPEEVNFTSKEVLVDSATGPAISGAAVQDLKLNPRQVQKLVEGGGLDHAVTLNRFGELVRLDADKKSDFELARRRYEEQAKEYADLKEDSAAEAAAAKVGTRDMLMQMMSDGDESPRGRRSTLNPLKRGGNGVIPGALDTGGGRVPMQGGRGARGRDR